MADQWETVRIFISSTFEDMHAERDYLVKQVFPELREWCEQRKLHLIDIDLRWGVREEDTQNRNVVEVCLNRLDEARPFFLCFMGQRRGWVPQEQDVSENTLKEDAFPDLRAAIGSNSVTELEIMHALVSPFHRSRRQRVPAEKADPVQYAFFYLRDPSYLNALPADNPEIRKVFTNEGISDPEEKQQADQELTRWTSVEIPALCKQRSRPLTRYSAQWDATIPSPELLLPMECPSLSEQGTEQWKSKWANAGIRVEDTSIQDPAQAQIASHFNQQRTQGRLTNFKVDEKPLRQIILEDLQQAISDRFPDHTAGEQLDVLQKDLDQQQTFLHSNCEGFIARPSDFQQLDEYILNEERCLFVLTARGGSGKSTLLANWIHHVQKDRLLKYRETLHYRFIGQSDRSLGINALLFSLLNEIKKTGGKFRGAISEDVEKLRYEFVQYLEEIGEQGKTIIVLDALDQLDTSLTDLAWLPLTLPENIKMIVSFKQDLVESTTVLHLMGNHILHAQVAPFSAVEDRHKLVDTYLAQYLKELDERHIDALIQVQGTNNPLFLKIILGELRVFGSFSNLGEMIHSNYGETPVAAFKHVLQRLENDPATTFDPHIFVPFLFGLLSQSRYGLSAEEIGAIMIRSMPLPNPAIELTEVMDHIHLYLRQVRPYMTFHDGRYAFFFDSFRAAAQERYVGDLPHQRPTQEWHALLAQYFYDLPTWENEDTRHATLRKVSELPYHATLAQQWERVFAALTDFSFLEAKITAYPVTDLEKDYALAIQKWGAGAQEREVLEKMRECILRNSQILSQTPHLVFPILYHGIAWKELPLLTPIFEKECSIHHNWLRSIDSPENHAEQIKSEFHTGEITSVAISPDGKSILSGSADNSIILWDLLSGKMKNHMVGHQAQITALAFSPDGSNAVSGSSIGNIHLWDLATGKILRSLAGHKQAISSLSYVNDGKAIVCDSRDRVSRWDLQNDQVIVSNDVSDWIILARNGNFRLEKKLSEKTLRIVDTRSNIILAQMECERLNEILKTALAPDGSSVVITFQKGDLMLWSPAHSNAIHIIEHNRKINRSLIYTKDENSLFRKTANGGLEQIQVRTNQPIRSFNGHTTPNTVFVLSQDEKYLLGGSADGSLNLWDTTTGNLLRRYQGHSGAIQTLAFSPDGKYFLSGAQDRTFKFWDIKSAKVIHDFQHDVGSISISTILAIANDASFAISTEWKRIKLWDLRSGILLQTLNCQIGNIQRVMFSPDNSRMYCCDQDEMIEVWDLVNYRILYSGKPGDIPSDAILRSIEGHDASIDLTLIAPDGNTAISCSQAQLKHWDLQSGRLLKMVSIGNKRVLSAAFVRGEAAICIGLSDATLQYIDLASGKIIRSFGFSKDNYPNAFIYPKALSSDAKKLFCRSDGETIQVWDLENGTLLHSLEGHRTRITRIAVAENAERCISCEEGQVIVWDTQTGHRMHSIPTEMKNGNLALSSRGNTALLFDPQPMNETMSVLDTRTGVITHTYRAPRRGIFTAMAVMLDERHAILAGSDNMISVLDIHSGNIQLSIQKTSRISQLAVSPDGRKAISDNPLEVWDTSSGQVLGTFPQHTKRILSLCFSTDGELVHILCDDKSVASYKIRSGQLVESTALFDRSPSTKEDHFEPGHSLSISALVLNPDRKTMLTASRDHTIKQWDLETRQVIRTITSPSDMFTSLAVSPDGKMAASTSMDRKIKLWDIPSGQVVRIYEKNAGTFSTVAFTPDGNSIISGSMEKTVQQWDVHTGKLLREFQDKIGNTVHIAVSPDGKYILGGNPFSMWDINDGTLQFSSATYAGVLSPTGNTVLFNIVRSSVQVRDVLHGLLLCELEDSADITNSNCLKVSADGKTALGGNEQGILKVWDLTSGKLHKSISAAASALSSVSISAQGTMGISISLGDSSQKTRIWDLVTGDLIRSLETAEMGYVFTPDNTALWGAIPGKYRTAALMDIHSGECLREFTDQERSNSMYAVSPDGKIGMNASANGPLKVWDLHNGELLRTLEGDPARIHSLAISPDNRFALSASQDDNFSLWDLQNGKLLTRFDIRKEFGKGWSYTSTTFSCDAKYAFGFYSGKIVGWDLPSGELKTYFDSFPASSLDFTQDGRFAIIGSNRGVRLFDVHEHILAPVFFAGDGQEDSVVLTSNGKQALSISNQRTIRSWDLEERSSRVLLHHEATINYLLLSPDETKVIFGDATGKVLFYEWIH